MDKTAFIAGYTSTNALNKEAAWGDGEGILPTWFTAAEKITGGGLPGLAVGMTPYLTPAGFLVSGYDALADFTNVFSPGITMKQRLGNAISGVGNVGMTLLAPLTGGFNPIAATLKAGKAGMRTGKALKAIGIKDVDKALKNWTNYQNKTTEWQSKLLEPIKGKSAWNPLTWHRRMAASPGWHTAGATMPPLLIGSSMKGSGASHDRQSGGMTAEQIQQLGIRPN
jgi:hypothetical protein